MKKSELKAIIRECLEEVVDSGQYAGMHKDNSKQEKSLAASMRKPKKRKKRRSPYDYEGRIERGHKRGDWGYGKA